MVENEQQFLLYEVQGKDKRTIRHRVQLGPALGQLESIRAWMTGRMARSQAGILSKTSNDAAARHAGHEPVREKVKRGLVHKATYERGEDGKYEKTTHSFAPSLVEEAEDETA